MNEFEGFEERVIYNERFQGARLDFRARTCFQRFDCCEFVKATILMDSMTQGLAFTNCVFEDCNIDGLHSDERRSVIARDNTFKAPIEQRRSEFEKRLADAWPRGRIENVLDSSLPAGRPGASTRSTSLENVSAGVPLRRGRSDGIGVLRAPASPRPG